MDRIVVYSNGIADHQRRYTVGNRESRRIGIPVRRDHLADVLASLNVFGTVTIVRPPSFTPSDVDAGTVDIDVHNALEGLATSLSGSRVTVERPAGVVTGRLLGLHREPEGTAGDPIAPASLVVLTERGLRNLPVDEITNLAFDDEAAREEIEKALARNVQRIKPHSTFVELELLADGDAETEAVVQYTLPAAAWKMTYRLRERSDGRYDLQGFAVVTNDTDDDWNRVSISVVTGEPTTFSTDLAETKVPRRRHVNVVRGEALGAVEVDEEFAAGAVYDMDGADLAAAESPMARERSKAESRVMRAAFDSLGARAGTTSADVGDFCVFESEAPVSIAARRSAVIPMFLVALDESNTVLHYRAANHAERPFRAVDFTNATTYSLGRGVCTVYQSDVYAGSCVLPALKPGEGRLLPHALETGVHVHRETKEDRTTTAIRIAEGVCRTTVHSRWETRYRVRSHRDESPAFVLDHDTTFRRGNVTATILRDGGEQPLEPAAGRKGGPRFRIELAAGEELAIRVVETLVEDSQVVLVTDDGETRDDWLRTSLVATNGPLASHPGLAACLAIRDRLGERERAIDDANDRIRGLEKRQERLRENVRAGGEGEQAARWRADLAAAEDEITTIEETTLPALRTEAAAVETELRDALRSLEASWSA